MNSPPLRWIGLLTCAALMAWGFVTWHRSAVLFDDAFISFHYADNLVRGLGLVFNPGERVEGYTNFFWVMLAAAALKAHFDPLTVARAAGVASYLLILALCSRFCVVQIPSNRPRNYFLLSLLAVLVLTRGFASLAGTGMETVFVALLVLIMGLTLRFPTTGKSEMALASLVLLLAPLTRLDASLFVAVSFWVTLTEGRGKREILHRFAVPVLGLAGYCLWKYSYYGALLPNTYTAKAADAWNLQAGWAYVLAFARSYPQVLVLLPFAIVGHITARRTSVRPFARFAALSSLLYLAYVIKVGGDFMEYRFLFVVYPLFFCLATIGFFHVAAQSFWVSAAAAVLSVTLSMSPIVLENKFGMQSLAEMDVYTRVGTKIGETFRHKLPPETVIATTLAGTIPYYSRLTTVDQWGLNDKSVGQLVGQRLIYRGHVKRASDAYLRSRDVNLVLDHPTTCPCSAPWQDGRPDVFVRMEGDECVRTWYLVQRPELTDYLCHHPDDFVLSHVDCPIQK